MDTMIDSPKEVLDIQRDSPWEEFKVMLGFVVSSRSVCNPNCQTNKQTNEGTNQRFCKLDGELVYKFTYCHILHGSRDGPEWGSERVQAP